MLRKGYARRGEMGKAGGVGETGATMRRGARGIERITHEGWGLFHESEVLVTDERSLAATPTGSLARPAQFGEIELG